MFNKDNYVIYMTKQNRVLLYNKYTKKIIALANDQYQLLQKYTEGTATPDSATMNFWSSCGLLLDYSSNEGSRGAMSIYELDRKFHPNIFFKILEFILSYLSFPIWVCMFMLCYDNIFLFVNNLQFKDIIYIPFVFLLFIIGLLLHEFSHMIVAINSGAYVPELVIGVKHHMVFYGYTRIIGMENIVKRNRIKIYYAGIAMNFLGSAFFMALYFFFPLNLYLIAALIFMFQAFANSSIFDNGDGYDIVFSIFNNIGLPRKFGPKFMRENIANKQWIIMFPTMNMFGTLVLPVILIIQRLINYTSNLILPNTYYICVVFCICLCLVFSFCKVKQQVLLVIIAAESMLLTFLTLVVSADNILLHTPALVMTIFFIPAIESIFFLVLSVCCSTIWENVKERKLDCRLINK